LKCFTQETAIQNATKAVAAGLKLLHERKGRKIISMSSRRTRKPNDLGEKYFERKIKSLYATSFFPTIFILFSILN
jgi:hypothetical protein